MALSDNISGVQEEISFFSLLSTLNSLLKISGVQVPFSAHQTKRNDRKVSARVKLHWIP